jgi:diaminohydroxyphosphoribosylaminopyrimidine deaminase / 5-amino-6-(5-phosphoribosylamino)uracil reductase
MYSESDPRFMQRALELSALALDATPNPRVGCVVVRDDQVLGEGFTQRPGSNHAEIEALQDARRRGHDVHWRDGLCHLGAVLAFWAHATLRYGADRGARGRVVAAVEDPNPQVSGRGMEMLRSSGIDVRCGLLRQEAVEANIGFFSRMNRARPWVRVKLAGSLDGRSALDNGVSQWITGEAARADGSCVARPRLRHPDRHRHGAGRRPATDRAPGCGHAPAAQGSGRQSILRRGDGASIRRQSGPGGSRPGRRGQDGAPVAAQCPGAAPARSGCARRPGRAAGRTGQRGINELHVEAGATLSGALVRQGLADELLLYQAPMFLGPGRGLLDLPKLDDLKSVARWRVRELRDVGGDIRILARRE